MARKENQRIALTRRLLQEGLLRLLATEKLEDISVTALCKEAGINRATFYNHYNSPPALLGEMEHALVVRLQEINSDTETMEDMLNQTEESCVMLRENADLLQVLVRYHADRDLERIVQDIAKHYNERRLGASRKIMDPDTIHLVSTYLYSGCYHLIREWLVRDIQKTPREIAELLVSIVSKEYL